MSMTVGNSEAINTRNKIVKFMQEVKQINVNPFESFQKRIGYAHYDFNGILSEEFINKLGRMPDKDEIIALVDGVTLNFGASCLIHGRKFSGYVNTD